MDVLLQARLGTAGEKKTGDNPLALVKFQRRGKPTIRWFILEPEKRGLSAGEIADLRSSAHEISERNQILLFI